MRVDGEHGDDVAILPLPPLPGTSHPREIIANVWGLLAHSGRAEQWPERFTSQWPHPRKPDVSCAVVGETMTVGAATLAGAEVARIPEGTELRLVSMVVQARDYSGHIFQFLGAPIPADLYIRPVLHAVAELTDAPIIAWPTSDGLVAIVTVALLAGASDSQARYYRIWPATGAETIERTIPPTVSVSERKRLERARRLAHQLVVKMTLRGRPTEHRDAARTRLLEAAIRLRKRDMKIGRRELTRPLMVDSVDAVAGILARAEWTLEDLEEQLNKTHTEASWGS